MGIRDWPREERPREKLLARGAQALSDAELLALFLGSGGAGEDAVSSARGLIARHGSLAALLARDARAMLSERGLGPARCALLLAAQELGARVLSAQLQRGPAIADERGAGLLFRQRLAQLPHEVFACLFLDSRHRMLAFEELFRGTIDGSEVHPREVVRRCLAHNAAAVIIGHNHPSGIAEPSAADRQITRRLQEALGLIDVRLLDHFVVGEGEPYSFAARGIL
jgi:DNA repair protein RadC